jgi:ribosomal-protein-alanine N-acetyltransferase
VNEWRVEPAAPEDLEPILELERCCFEWPWGRLSVEGEMGCPDSTGFVVKRGSPESKHRVIAFIFFRFIAGEVHIFRIAVAPEWRRRGIGSALVARCLESARRRGVLSASLEVRASNVEAAALYAKHGFRVAARRPGYYSDNREDALILNRDIKEEENP